MFNCVFLLACIVFAALCSAIPRPILHSSLTAKSIDGNSQEANGIIYANVPCAACLPSGADADLGFTISSSPSANACENALLTLNDVVVDRNQPTIQVLAGGHTIDLNINSYCDSTITNSTQVPQQAVFFDVARVNGADVISSPSFTVLLGASRRPDFLLDPTPGRTSTCDLLSSNNEYDYPAELLIENDSAAWQIGSENVVPASSAETDRHASTNSDQSQFLRRRLRDQLEIMQQLKNECPRRLCDKLKSCNHDLSCSGKTICHHFLASLKSLLLELQASLRKTIMVSEQRNYQAIINDEKNTTLGGISDHSSVADEHEHILLVALEILAGLLGLTALCKLVSRRFSSLRRRVEHLADREERRRARHYRRLASRQAIRKKWVAFTSLFQRANNGTPDYEEKRAMILEDGAALAFDAYACEASSSRHTPEQNLSDEVAGLRYAHQLVTAMLQGGNDDLTSTPSAGITNMVAAAERFVTRQSSDTRSRSSSLPSYESEKLPEYASQEAESSDDSSSDVDIPVANGYRMYNSSLSDISTTSTAFTPGSSIPDVGSRYSEDTLRTGFSRD